jgi:tetratricopeptide (TPR) repeat protein
MNTPGPDTPDYRILTSRFISSHQWDRALEAAQEWLAQDPNNTSAHFVAGQSLINLKRYPEAEPHLATVLANKPQHDRAHRMMSILQFYERRYQAADESIHKALSINPRDAYHWYHLAWMLYKQGEGVSARKYVEKARELSPRDAVILNLLVLCTPKTKANSHQILQQYHEALELDPQNPQIHNNIGIYYLNVEKNFPAAEDCFRRALFFDPTLKIARSNLFLVIKRRDKLYWLLSAPRDMVFNFFNSLRRRRTRGILTYVLILIVWLMVFRFVFAILALWALFVWPMLKTYEYLTIGDLRAQAGDIGAKRGGIFGYRRWPLGWRLALFGGLLALFWGSIGFAIYRGINQEPDQYLDIIFSCLIILGVILMMVLWVRGRHKSGRRWFRSRKKTAEIDRLLEGKPNRAPVKK